MERVEIEVYTALHLNIIVTTRLLKARSQCVSKGGRRNISAYLDGELPPV